MTDIESALVRSLKDEPSKWLFNEAGDKLHSVNRELGVSVRSSVGGLGKFSASVGELDFGPYAAFVWHEAANAVNLERQKLHKSRESEAESERLRSRLGLK